MVMLLTEVESHMHEAELEKQKIAKLFHKKDEDVQNLKLSEPGFSKKKSVDEVKQLRS